jgi:hypothetical protein
MFQDKEILNELCQIRTSLVGVATKADVQKLEKLMALSQTDLDNAIAALPGALETALESELTAAIAPIIAAIQAKTPGIDLTAEVNAINALTTSVPAAVVPAVTTAITPAS